MDSAQRLSLAREVLAAAPAGTLVEALVGSNATALTRFTHNAIHQNLDERDTVVRVRVVSDNRSGVATTNDTSSGALRDTLERASAMAQLAPADDAFPGMAAQATAPQVEAAYVQATADATPAVRAQSAKRIFEAAEAQGLWAAGYVTTASSGITIANTQGASLSFDSTDAATNVKQNAADATGFAEAYNTDVHALDTGALGARAAAKAVGGRDPVAVEPGEWTVILEPAAFGELLSYLTGHFSAQAFDEGSSFLSDGLEKTYAGENLTIWDDYAHPLAPGMPFDYEGTLKQRLPLIERGVAKSVVTDAYWAKRLGRANTGHALPLPNAAGPQATSIVLAGGSKPAAQLIAETQRGLLVSRFWYIRPIDRRQTIVTGMTRDGTFLIENGEVGRGVRNMRFNQSILRALANAEFSAEQARTGGYSYSIVVPTAKIDGFRFSSVTTF